MTDVSDPIQRLYNSLHSPPMSASASNHDILNKFINVVLLTKNDAVAGKPANADSECVSCSCNRSTGTCSGWECVIV